MSEIIKDQVDTQAFQDVNPNYNSNNIHKEKPKGIFIIIFILLILSLASSIILFFQNNKINESMVLLNNSIEKIEIDSALNSVKLNRLQLSQRVNDGIVNDQFVIVKSTFYDKASYIDVDTQPSMNSQYKGEGNFSTEDRELKKYLINLMNELESGYNDYMDISMTPFKELKIYLTIKNYDIGIYENGILTLSGE